MTRKKLEWGITGFLIISILVYDFKDVFVTNLNPRIFDYLIFFAIGLWIGYYLSIKLKIKD
jgi:hypothetical protein